MVFLLEGATPCSVLLASQSSSLSLMRKVVTAQIPVFRLMMFLLLLTLLLDGISLSTKNSEHRGKKCFCRRRMNFLGILWGDVQCTRVVCV